MVPTIHPVPQTKIFPSLTFIDYYSFILTSNSSREIFTQMYLIYWPILPLIPFLMLPSSLSWQDIQLPFSIPLICSQIAAKMILMKHKPHYVTCFSLVWLPIPYRMNSPHLYQALCILLSVSFTHTLSLYSNQSDLPQIYHSPPASGHAPSVFPSPLNSIQPLCLSVISSEEASWTTLYTMVISVTLDHLGHNFLQETYQYQKQNVCLFYLLPAFL